jgi:2-phosphosulfolactate phosphatase
MQIRKIILEQCSSAAGIVVVIDVLRAFTTAAFAFSNGAQEILLTGSVEDAFKLRKRFPQALLMGEVNGLPIPGFDYSNSPLEIRNAALQGRRLIQRTTAGTQGVVRSVNASYILAASFVCATATARRIQQLGDQTVTFVITGKRPDRDGDEDEACADFISQLLLGNHPGLQPYLDRVYRSYSGGLFTNQGEGDFLADDLHLATQADCFDFAMQVSRRQDLFVMTRIKPG